MNTLMRLRTDIPELLREHITLFEPFEQVYLFGSSLNSSLPHNDIDILVIYTEYSDAVQVALMSISTALEEAIGLFIDLTALSIEELEDTEFLEKIRPHYMKLK